MNKRTLSDNVSGIVPPHCSGCSFVFEPGVLHVKKDGSGYIVVNEEDFVLEDDRDGEGGSIYWIARMDASEITALRDFLNGAPAEDKNETASIIDRLPEIAEKSRAVGAEAVKQFGREFSLSNTTTPPTREYMK